MANDLISRQAAIEITEVFTESIDAKLIKNRLLALPSAESEIITCRVCENHHTEDCPMTFEEDISWDDDGYIEYDTVFHDNAEDDGYCHMGKRRTDE